MKRTSIFATATIATLIASPMAKAQTAVAQDDLTGVEKLMADPEPAVANVTEDQREALIAAVGGDLRVTTGETIGVVTDVTYDASGNPEIVVDLNDETKIDAEELVVTVLPEGMQLIGNAILLDTTLDEIVLSAVNSTESGYSDRAIVSIM